jgi:DNA-binding MarR family transcriptional regulator
MIHARSHLHGLYPAQWSAIRYFHSRSGSHRTAIALARYQGIAFGAVARTVRTLVARRFLRKAGSAGRGRGEIIEVTPEGEAILAHDPLLTLAEAIAQFDAGKQEALAEVLDAILRSLDDDLATPNAAAGDRSTPD